MTYRDVLFLCDNEGIAKVLSDMQIDAIKAVQKCGVAEYDDTVLLEALYDANLIFLNKEVEKEAHKKILNEALSNGAYLRCLNNQQMAAWLSKFMTTLISTNREWLMNDPAMFEKAFIEYLEMKHENTVE